MSVVNRKSTKSLMEGTIRDAGAGCEKAGEKLGDVELAGNENVDTQDEESGPNMMDELLGGEASKQRILVTNKTAREKEQLRFQKMLESVSDYSPKYAPYLRACAPLAAKCAVACEVLVPVCVRALGLAAAALALLPLDLLYVLLGLLLCFFGGMYPMTMAALEAWRQAGGKEALNHAHDLWAELGNVLAASEEDDAKDDDGDGIPDVDQMGGKELALRKVKLAITTADPDKLNGALLCMYAGWVGVVAVLKLQFAKTIALGAAIGDFLHKTAAKPCTAVLATAMPPEYHKWIPTLITWLCKLVAIAVAWQVQRIISAFHSAVRGGLMSARGLVE